MGIDSKSVNIEKLSIWGNPNIGIYVYANNRIIIAPPSIEKKAIDIIADTLRVDNIIYTTISGMNIVGVLVAGNDKGLLLPRTIRSDEYNVIKKEFDGNIGILKSIYNAVGNMVACNNYGAVTHIELDDEHIKLIKEVLEIDTVARKSVAKIPTVGSVVVVNNKGGLTHPETTDEELEELSNIFRVPVDVGTVNFGVGFIRSGLIANDHGAVVGTETTGPEIMRIAQMLLK